MSNNLIRMKRSIFKYYKFKNIKIVTYGNNYIPIDILNFTHKLLNLKMEETSIIIMMP